MHQNVVLDLQDLQFVDSAGLRVILAAHERSRHEGKELALTQAQSKCSAFSRSRA